MAGPAGISGRRAAALPSTFKKNPFLLFGLPMILFVVAGSIGLTEFSKARFQIDDSKRLVGSAAAAASAGAGVVAC